MQGRITTGPQQADTRRETRDVPFTHEITVGWADCDPAAIAFTGRIPYWSLEAIEVFWREIVGVDWYALNLDLGFGTPFVHMSLDFSAPVTPRHRLICTVEVERLGTTSITFRVRGAQGGKACFAGRFTCVFVHADRMAPTPPPPDIRARLESALVPAA